MIQQPLEFGAGKIRVHHQAGFFADDFLVAAGLELIAGGGCAPILPDNGWCKRNAARPIPKDGGFPLVGNTDGANVAWCEPGLRHGFTRDPQLAAPDFSGVMFDPSRLRKVLGKFLLAKRKDVAGVVKYKCARTGRALIKG